MLYASWMYFKLYVYVKLLFSLKQCLEASCEYNSCCFPTHFTRTMQIQSFQFIPLFRSRINNFMKTDFCIDPNFWLSCTSILFPPIFLSPSSFLPHGTYPWISWDGEHVFQDQTQKHTQKMGHYKDHIREDTPITLTGNSALIIHFKWYFFSLHRSRPSPLLFAVCTNPAQYS